MSARIGTMSIDGTPISEADMARIHAEEQLHATQQRSAVKIIASTATDAADCRLLLSILGLDGDVAGQARAELASSHAAPAVKRARKKRAA